MKLSEIFSQLAYGELSQLSLVDHDTGLVPASKQAAMVAHTNLALSALYKRFNLKENRLRFKLVANQMNYPLTSQGDVLFQNNDNGEEFADDLLKVEQVLTAEGKELGLNNSADPYACVTPSATLLRVPLVVVNQGPDLPDRLKTYGLEVVYRANHPLILYNGAGFSPSRIEVELSASYLEPLLLFIASRVHNPIGMTQEFHAGNSYAAKYEQACARLESDGLEVDQGSQNTRAYRNGWV